MTYVSGKALVASIALACLFAGGPSPEASSVPLAWQAGCGQSMDALNRLKADLGLDRALADRMNSLAEAARGSGQPPPASQLDSLAEDGLDGLTDAGDQLEQAAEDIGRQLEQMQLTRQHLAWNRGVRQLQTARTNLRYVTRPGSLGAGRASGSLSPTGVGPQWIAEAAGAAGDVGSAAENLNRIALDGQFNNLGGVGIQQGARDMNPPPNPAPNPWDEMWRRLQAQQARIRNNVKGLNAARALQAREFQQAQQNTNDMRQAVQQAQDVADQLGQLAALCNQAQQQQAQNAQPQPANTPPPAQAAAAAKGGMGAGTQAALGLAAAGAAAGGVVLYQVAQACKEPDYQSSFQACASGSCGGCAAMIETFLPYCDCVEQKHAEAAGVGALCRQARDVIREAEYLYGCLVPRQMTRIPGAAIRR